MTFVANESLQSGRIGPAILPDDAAPDLDYALERFKAASRAASHSKTPSKGKDNRQGCGYEDILTLLNSRNSALSDATRARLKPLLEVLSRQLSRPDGPIVAREPVVRLTPRPKSALPVETVLQIGTLIQALSDDLKRFDSRMVDETRLSEAVTLLGHCIERWSCEAGRVRADMEVLKTSMDSDAMTYRSELDRALSGIAARLDDIARGMTENRVGAGLWEDVSRALDAKIADFEQQLTNLLPPVSSQHEDITRRMDALNNTVGTVCEAVTRSDQTVAELRDFTGQLKERLNQAPAVDGLKLKETLLQLAAGFEELKASSLASDKTVHTALREMETQLKALLAGISDAPHVDDEAGTGEIGRLTTAIRKINALEAEESDKSSGGDETATASLRGRLIDSAREAPLPLNEDTGGEKPGESSPGDDKPVFENQNSTAPLAVPAANSAGLALETTTGGRQAKNRKLDKRIGLMKRLLNVVSGRWSPRRSDSSPRVYVSAGTLVIDQRAHPPGK